MSAMTLATAAFIADLSRAERGPARQDSGRSQTPATLPNPLLQEALAAAFHLPAPRSVGGRSAAFRNGGFLEKVGHIRTLLDLFSDRYLIIFLPISHAGPTSVPTVMYFFWGIWRSMGFIFLMSGSPLVRQRSSV